MINRTSCATAGLFLLAVLTGNANAQTLVRLEGAGATFPAPLYAKWFANYTLRNPNVRIGYDPSGSEAGVRTLLAGGADFGASDNPQVLHELAPNQEDHYLLFPATIGAVVPIVNLPGMVKDISLTPHTLAGIYLGLIKKWNDPALKEINRGVSLPDLDITVVHRSDGSGTSFAWTDYLSQTSPEWKTQVGTSLNPKWPTGRGVTRNDGVAKLVKELGGSIGYVEFIYALQNHLSYARVQNQAGEFVAADLNSIAAAVNNSDILDAAFKGSSVNPPGRASYPIITFTWLVVPAHIADASKRIALTDFLRWMLGQGQNQAAALGYMVLPSSLVAREQTAIAKIQ